ncbi:peptide deformylase [Nocardiopsis sp. NRRL B-16309]|uniref:peptide deformylase n=1 Tax=Nocardiopsis sp. NRRL B-16309 TaxID=1519494 RepID=UPI0006AF52F4|nr:peptide deformylase [Nocardiopsis sp. NRRL B-16309]KOX15464.1 peptide deformylase [Nocardiopsis sp. NRRL B-16309]
MSEQSTPAQVAAVVQGREVAEYPELAPEAARGRVRRITVTGEEVLHRRCADVPREMLGGGELARLIDDMFVTMYAAEGVGLAANQVGVDLRVFVYDCPDDEGVRHVGHVVNPVLEERGAEDVLVVESEGCLSVPGPHADLGRLERATVRGVDREGAEVVLSGQGYFARCLQHETDHTLGRLYIDRLSARERKRVLKKMSEMADSVFDRREERTAELVREFGG